MPTRNIVLTDQQAQFVEQLVRSGRYQNASEVLREGLRMLHTREQEAQARYQSWQTQVVDVAGPSTQTAEADIDLLSRTFLSNQP